MDHNGNLINVFLHADLPSLQNLCSTSRFFHEMCNDDYLWKLKTVKDFGTSHTAGSLKAWKETYIKMWNLPNKIPIESWLNLLNQITIDDDQTKEDLIDILSNILKAKQNIQKNLYYSDKEGSTILSDLIWLYRDVDGISLLNNIKGEIFNAYLSILDAGYDVNKDRDGGKLLILPMATLMDLDGITENVRWKFAEPLFRHGLDVNKRNIWDGFKHVDNYLEIYDEWNGVSLDFRIRSKLK